MRPAFGEREGPETEPLLDPLEFAGVSVGLGSSFCCIAGFIWMIRRGRDGGGGSENLLSVVMWRFLEVDIGVWVMAGD